METDNVYGPMNIVQPEREEEGTERRASDRRTQSQNPNPPATAPKRKTEKDFTKTPAPRRQSCSRPADVPGERRRNQRKTNKREGQIYLGKRKGDREAMGSRRPIGAGRGRGSLGRQWFGAP